MPVRSASMRPFVVVDRDVVAPARSSRAARGRRTAACPGPDRTRTGCRPARTAPTCARMPSLPSGATMPSPMSRDVADAVLVRVVHRARMERGDLVVVEVGDDERLRRVRARHVAHAVDGDAERVEALAVVDRRRRRSSPSRPARRRCAAGCTRCCRRSRPTRGASRRSGTTPTARASGRAGCAARNGRGTP